MDRDARAGEDSGKSHAAGDAGRGRRGQRPGGDAAQSQGKGESQRRGQAGGPGRRRGGNETWRTHAPAARLQTRSVDSQRRARDVRDVEGLQPRQLAEIYRFMFLTRRLEEHLVALKRQNAVVGSVYRSLGQEATAVGCAYAMGLGDCVQPLIRDLGAVLVHGVRPIAIFRQYLAKVTGPTAGRDLNVHFSAPERGIVGPVSMLGTTIPVVAGVLLAARLRGEARAGLAFIGDGGSSTGAFYEGINFAAVQRLPLIVVVEANGFAFSTPTDAQLPLGDLVCRARGFGVSVAEVDGNDALACYGATAAARQRARRGDGPTLVVAHTFRRLGHTDHDGQDYADADEVAAWGARNDPLTRLRELLLRGKHLAEPDVEALEQQVQAALEAARERASSEAAPDPATVKDGVFAEDTPGPWPAVDTWLGEGANHRPADAAAPVADQDVAPANKRTARGNHPRSSRKAPDA